MKIKESILKDVHYFYVFCKFGEKINVWKDREITTMSQNSYFKNEPENLLMQVTAKGLGNVNPDTEYADNWCEWDGENNRYLEIFEPFRSFTLEKMIQTCINEGEFVDLYESWFRSNGLTEISIIWGE